MASKRSAVGGVERHSIERYVACTARGEWNDDRVGGNRNIKVHIHGAGVIYNHFTLGSTYGVVHNDYEIGSRGGLEAAIGLRR